MQNHGLYFGKRSTFKVGVPYLWYEFTGGYVRIGTRQQGDSDLTPMQSRPTRWKVRCADCPCRLIIESHSTVWLQLEAFPIHTDSYWFPVSVSDAEIMCVNCRMCKTMEELEYHQSSPATCINCSANCQDQFKVSAPTISARKSVMTMAMRLQVAFESGGINYVDISQDFRGWLTFAAAASLIANAAVWTHGDALMKSVSHMGGIRVPPHQAREIFKNGRGRQFGIYRECLKIRGS